MLEATRDIRIPARQGALIYALLASANQTDAAPAAFPRDLLLDVPEENRLVIRAGEPYAFGGTLLANSPAEAAGVLVRLRTGLERLGREGTPRPKGFGGNFRVQSVQDLIAMRELTDQHPESLDANVVSREIQTLLGRTELTLTFLSPLRLERPGEFKRGHKTFCDGDWFDAFYFVMRLLERMAKVGVLPRADGARQTIDALAVQAVENRLAWRDLTYGHNRKSLGGAVGRVRLRIAPDNTVLLAALVWGQWTRAGKSSRFGHGRYRIEELGVEPFACPPAVSLLDTPKADCQADRSFSKAGFATAARVRLVEELGWKEAASPKRPHGASRVLPGETGGRAALGQTAIVGPEATHLEWRPGELHCHYAGGRDPTEIPLAGLETLVVLGRLGLSADIVHRLCELSVSVIMADDRGLPFGMIAADESIPPAVVMAQVDAARSPVVCLNIAKSLVVAKLHNYRRLAEGLSLPDASCVETLARSIDRARDAVSIAELRGIEGYGAATWYGTLPKVLGRGFPFERRVAPDAEDPVNVLLNIAHTLGHRLSLLALRSAGLSPALGFLHDATTRFSPLASDLQEPFRSLMDRLVIDATHQLHPKDFRLTQSGPYRVAIAPAAARQFQLMLWQGLSLAVACVPPSPTTRFESSAETALELGQPTGYRHWMERQARQLRRSLLADGGSSFQPFQLP